MHIATTHRNTDFDGLASIIAATLLYPGTVAVCPKNVNPNVHRFLSRTNPFALNLAGGTNRKKPPRSSRQVMGADQTMAALDGWTAPRPR
jgi:hypothetical protein